MTRFEASQNMHHEGAYLVYINGIEIPCEQVSTRWNTGSYPTATLSVLPDPELVGLGKEDRVEVAIFYKDNHYATQMGRSPEFCLLGEFDIIGQVFSNTAFGRRLNFHCVGKTQFLDIARPDVAVGGEAAAYQALQTPSGTHVSTVQSSLTFPWSMLFRGYARGDREIKRPYDIVESFMRILVSIQESEEVSAVPSANFFGRYIRRHNFLHRFIPSPVVENQFLSEKTGVFPVLESVRNYVVLEAVANQTASIGLGESFYTTIQSLFMSFAYELGYIPSPPMAQVDFTPDSSNNGVVLGPPVWESPDVDEGAIEQEAKVRAYQEFLADGTRSYTEEQKEEFLANRTEALIEEFRSGRRVYPNPLHPNCILEHVTKPVWLYGIPPTSNVLFPSMIQEINYEESYLDQPTRMYANDQEYYSLYMNTDAASSRLAAQLYGYPPQVQQELDKKKSIQNVGNPIVSGKNLLVWPEEFFRGPHMGMVNVPGWYTKMDQILQGFVTERERSAREALDKIENEFSDIFQQAVTQVYQELQGIDDNVAAEERLTEVEDKLISESGRAELVMEYLRENNLITKGIETVNEARDYLQGLANTKEYQIDRLKKRVARYEYNRMRGATRSGGVVGVFNPYVVPGYPAMVFDDLTSAQHFGGLVVSVSHNFSSDSMSTTYSFAHAQTLDELVHEVFDARIGNNATKEAYPNVNAAPISPLDTTRVVSQQLEECEEYFSRLLHQAATFPESKTKRAAFDFAQAIRFVMKGGQERSFDDAFDDDTEALQKKRLELKAFYEEKAAADYREREAALLADLNRRREELETIESGASDEELEDIINTQLEAAWEAISAQYENERIRAALRLPADTLESETLNNYVAIKPSKQFAPMFESHDQAMRFVARPACTLEDYIDFRGNYGVRKGTVSAYDPVQGKGAKFYTQILQLEQGPGEAPTFDQENYLKDITPDELPDTRTDWQTKLFNYRQKVLFGRAGYKPDLDTSLLPKKRQS